MPFFRWIPLFICVGGGCSIDQEFGSIIPNPGGDDDDQEGSGGDGSTDDDCTSYSPADAFDFGVDEACVEDPEIGLIDPVVKWSTASDLTLMPTSYSHVVVTPVVGQLTDDNDDGRIDQHDIPDIVFSTYETYGEDGALRIVSGDGRAVHATVQTLYHDGEPYFVGSRGGIALGDLDGDGFNEIVLVTREGHVAALDRHGQTQWVCTEVQVGAGSYPAIANLDGTGDAEILVGRHIVSAQGVLLGSGTQGAGTPNSNPDGDKKKRRGMSFAVDLDLDPTNGLEVVAGNTLYRMDGSVIASTGGPDGFAAVGNFDDDPEGELVLADGSILYLYDFVDDQDGDGAPDFVELWRFMISGMSDAKFNGGPPTVADFDGDGTAEIGIAASSEYFIIDKYGTKLWSQTITDQSSAITGSAVFDFNADGQAEVVYAGEHNLWILNGQDGQVLFSMPHRSRTQMEYPVIADVDGDGSTEIVLAHSSDVDFPHTYDGISVLGSATDRWAPARKVWNQHAYHVTNIEEDGGIPLVQTPNWVSFNTFRSGHTEVGLAHWLADPVVADFEHCPTRCSDGIVDTWLFLGNSGLAASETFHVRIYNEANALIHEESVGALQSGEGLRVGPIQISETEWQPGPLYAVIEDVSDDCDDTNNTILLGTWPCE